MPRKPLFQPPVARGQPGWLVKMAQQLTGEEPAPPEVEERPKAGEKGWLVSMAKDMERGSLSSGAGEQTQSESGSYEQGEQLSGKDGNMTSTGLSANSQNSGSQKISQSQSQDSLTSSMELLASDTVMEQIKALLSSQTQSSQPEVISKEIKSSQTLDIVTDTEQLLVTSDTNTVSEIMETAVTTYQENSEPEKQNGNYPENTDEILQEISVPAMDDAVTEEHIEDIDEVKPSASAKNEEIDSVKETSIISGLLDQILKKMDVEKMSQPVEKDVSQSMKVEGAKTSDNASSEPVTEVIAVKSKYPTSSVQPLVCAKITTSISQTKITPESVVSSMSKSDTSLGLTSYQHQDEDVPDINSDDFQTEDCNKTKFEDVPSIISTYEHDKENIPNKSSYLSSKQTARTISQSQDRPPYIVCKPKKAYITNKLKDVPSSSKLETASIKKRKKPSAKASSKRKKSVSDNESREGLFPVARKSRVNLKQRGSNKHGAESVISARSALLSLQRRRTAQTWVQCSLMECSRWRLLSEMDPSMVREQWQCSDNPDPKYGDCSVAEQEWTDSDMWVENRFTVGSLVMARTGGWPAWPAMVDDCPDTGDFFLNDVRADGSWVPRPSKYHVVFFEENAVSRAWVPDSKIWKFNCTEMNYGKKSSEKINVKLQYAFEIAKEASKESLLTRRSKYCLANRFKGPWGPVWPFWEPQEDLRKSPGAVKDVQVVDLDLELSRTSMDIEELAVEMMPTEVSKDLLKTIRSANSRNVSLTDDNLLNNLLSDEKELQIEEALKLAPPPARLDHLWQDSNLYTKEMSSKVNDDPSSPVNASFQSDKGGLNSSLRQEIDEAVSSQTMVTPVKSKGLMLDKCTPTKTLLCLPSPKYHGLTSTPISSHIIQSGVRLTSPLPSVMCTSPFPKYPSTPRNNPVLPSPVQSPVVGGCGDCSPLVKVSCATNFKTAGNINNPGGDCSSPILSTRRPFSGDRDGAMRSPRMGSNHKTPVKNGVIPAFSPVLGGDLSSPVVRVAPVSPVLGGALRSPAVGGALRSPVVGGVPCSPGLQGVPCSPLLGDVRGSPSLSEGYKRLDVSRGSNAFSADGSFMEL